MGEARRHHEYSESAVTSNPEILAMFRRRARRTGVALKWNRHTFLLTYAVLAATVIVALRVQSELIMAPVAVLGLVLIWVFSNVQEKRFEHESLRDEFQAYKELLSDPSEQSTDVEIGPAAAFPPHASLSNRELEVLGQIATGKSNKEAARDLYITEQTVKNHIKHIFTKLEVTDRTSAILLAMRHGWIESSSLGDQPRPQTSARRGGTHARQF